MSTNGLGLDTSQNQPTLMQNYPQLSPSRGTSPSPRSSSKRNKKTLYESLGREFNYNANINLNHHGSSGEEVPKINTDFNVSASSTKVVVPDLYDMILALNSDCGFDSFFKNLIAVLETNFGAERISIALPIDPSDIVNIPWGLKALWNKENRLPLTPQFSSSLRHTTSSTRSPFDNSPTKKSNGNDEKIDPHNEDFENDSSWDTDSEAEDKEFEENSNSNLNHGASKLSRTTSFRKKIGLKKHLSQKVSCPRHDEANVASFLGDNTDSASHQHRSPIQSNKNLPSPETTSSLLCTSYNSNMLIFEQLRTLEWEEDPLIDSQGILNVLEQDRLVLLQRKYLKNDNDEENGFELDNNNSYYLESKSTDPKLYESRKLLKSLNFLDSDQAINSPWSTSPALSPAIRESQENPFFTTPVETMESAFKHPGTGFIDSDMYLLKPVSAIGFEDTYSIIHMLVVVPGSSAGTSRSAPIAMISFMSSLIPFPRKFCEILDKLAPHVANSFLQARAHSTLTSQLSLAKHPNCHQSLQRIGSNSSSFATLHPHDGFSSSSPHNLKFKLESVPKTGLKHLEAQKKFYTSLREDKTEDSITTTSFEIFANEDATITPASPSPQSKFHNISSSFTGQKGSPQSPIFPIFGRRSRVRPQIRRLLYSHGASLVNEPERASDLSENITRSRHSFQERRLSNTSSGFSMATPSNRLLRTIIDAIPVHVFTAEPVEGEITWVSNRTLAFRGQTAEQFCQNPASSLHPDDQKGYLEAWHEALRTGVPLGRLCNVQRFDGSYRSFFMRAVPLRDEKGAIIHWFFTMMDIHNQHKAELESIQVACETAGEQKYKILAESTPIIVFSTSPQEGMLYANNKWFDYSGLTPAETYGFHYMNAIHPEDRDKSKLPISLSGKVDENSLAERKESDGSYSVEIRLRNTEGKYRWHLAIFTCSDIENPAQSVWFGTCTDIHDQKIIQEKLKLAKDTAQRTIESKTRFLSNMSHEIRTPLIGISGMVGFLLDTELTEEQLDYCQTISSSSEALLMVINDILDLSKVESGKMTLTYSWFYVRRLVEEVNELLSSMAIAKNLELNYIIDSKVSPWIKGDRVRLRQVMLNLIGNAIKFTDLGEIFTYFTVDESKSTKETLTLLVEVHDTGRGFTLEDSQRMFKPFSQVHGYASSSPSGTGLGLVISRQLIELHKGKLTCEGVRDKGSTFRFTCQVKLPTEEDKPSDQQVQKELGNHNGNNITKKSHLLSPMNILIICPWKYTSQSIEHHIRATVLNPENCEISRISEIDEMNKMPYLKKLWTHIVMSITDLQILIGFFRKGPENFAGISKSTQFIILTSPTQKSTIFRKLSNISSGTSYHITVLAKPLKTSSYGIVFDPSMEKEESYNVKVRSAQQTLETQKKVFKGLREFVEGDNYRVLLAEDNLVNQKVISKFLTKAGFKCDVAADGEICTSKVFQNYNGFYDLILCDLDMPRKNGFDACSDIRKWEEKNGYESLPIVAMSAYVMSEVSDKCIEVGFTKYISKPVEFSVLRGTY